MSICSIKNLSLIADSKTILDNVSFDIARGEFVALLGPNGAGKSTLIKAMLGLNKGKISGQIEFSIKKNLIGYIPQATTSDNYLPINVKELLLTKLPGNNLFWPKLDEEKQLTECLKNVGLKAGSLKTNFNDLSGGEKQRVLIAYMLLSKPQFLILDEPVSGVDEVGEKTLFELLNALTKDGISILLVSHDMDLVSRYVDRVICFNKTIICQGKPAETLTAENIDRLYKDRVTHYHHHHG